MADPFTPKFVDLVKNVTTTTGTGDFTLGAAVNGFRGFTSALQVGDRFYYSCLGVDKPAEREVGRGMLLSGGKIAREPVGGAAKTNFTTGNKTIALIASAEWYEGVAGSVASATSAAEAANAAAASATGAVTAIQGAVDAVEADVGALEIQVASIDSELDGTVQDLAALEATVAGMGSGGGGSTSVATRTALAALPTATAAVLLREPGREGLFVWDSSNLSARVAADAAQGIYVAPTSDSSGASGAWVRRVDGPFDIRWFGGVADSTALAGGSFNGTANDAAFASARALLLLQRGGGAIRFPAATGAYRFTSRIVQTFGIQIVGDGWHENPGIVAGVSYSGPQAYPGSMLCFDADVGGFQFLSATDNYADAIEYEHQSATGSIIRDIMLYGGGGTGVSAHGIETRTVLNIDNVRIENFAGTGLRIEANSAGAAPFGSSDSGSYRRVACRFNRLHGFHVIGDDANVNHFDACDSALNGGVGYFIPGGLGNKFTNCHAATNNQSHPGNVYAGNHSGAQRSQCATDWAGLSDQYAGSYVALGAVAANVFSGCYAETGQGLKAMIVSPSLVIGGNLASAGAHTTGSIGPRWNGPQIGNINEIGADDSELVTVKGNLTITKDVGDTSVAFLRNVGLGAYSVLQMYSSQYGIGAGLDVITGLGNSAFSSTAFTFRNAAQTQTYFEHDGTNFILSLGSFRIGAVTCFSSSGVLQAAAFPALTGDVTTVAGTLATTIANDAVSYAKMQNVSATDRLLGRSSAGAGDVEEIVCTAAGRALLDDADAAAQRATLGLAAIASSGSGADLAAGSLTFAKVQNVAASRLLGNPTGGAASMSEIGLAGGLAFSGTDLTLGAITPASVTATGAVTSSGGKIGYATGAGGTVTQTANKSNGVTLNRQCGEITLNGAALAANTAVTFVLTNNTIEATDRIIVNHKSGGTFGAYVCDARAAAGSASVMLRNVSAGSLSEAVVLGFAVIKAVTA